MLPTAGQGAQRSFVGSSSSGCSLARDEEFCALMHSFINENGCIRERSSVARVVDDLFSLSDERAVALGSAAPASITPIH